MTLNNIFCSSANLERILDNLKDGIIAHDLNRRIFFFNKEAERITGYQRQEVLGRDCHEAFGAPLCGNRCLFNDGAPQMSAREDYAINTLTKSGEARCIDMSVTRMDNEDVKFIGVLAAFRDVNDLLLLKMRAEKLTSFANIIGQDSKMLQIFQQIKDVSSYEYPVHIYGETGTGKELVANAIHNESYRGGKPFVPINCGALPEGLIESELFGHVKGAFSGAIRDKKGRFELADGGTIFLDEIAELSKYMQVKLLRFLQENCFERVGGEKTISVKVKIISATNKDLKGEVKAERFREDLFYRLNVIPIIIPPLRERKNDIPLLIDHFLHEVEEKYGRGAPRISKDAMALMMDYDWPGNVRELQNAVQFAIVKCRRRMIYPDDLPLEFRERICDPPSSSYSGKLQYAQVVHMLKDAGGNKAKAARMLGVGRATLYRFLNEHPDALADPETTG